MAAEEWQHEEWNAVMVPVAGTAALADCGFSEKPKLRINHKGHEETRSSCDLVDNTFVILRVLCG
jgi:glutaredoxin-related protein